MTGRVIGSTQMTETTKLNGLIPVGRTKTTNWHPWLAVECWEKDCCVEMHEIEIYQISAEVNQGGKTRKYILDLSDFQCSFEDSEVSCTERWNVEWYVRGVITKTLYWRLGKLVIWHITSIAINYFYTERLETGPGGSLPIRWDMSGVKNSS